MTDQSLVDDIQQLRRHVGGLRSGTAECDDARSNAGCDLEQAGSRIPLHDRAVEQR
jgi:hypothetical protein